MGTTRSPRADLGTLAELGTAHLTRVIAVDSQSDEHSTSIPSSEGQRALSDHLAGFFGELGYGTEQDGNANLMVTIPSNLPEGASAPPAAFLVHMDTSEGTRAVPALEVTAAWDGERVPYPENDRLQVSVSNYPETACFVGEDLLHGPGRFPVGLDDKLGMAELMTLARVLHDNPEIPHGELLLVFRPDEEIGRMAAVEGLARELADRGIRHGYTVDGIHPFEVNVENFHGSNVRVTIAGRPLRLPGGGVGRRIALRLRGVNTHGATAKPEGHVGATTLFARATAVLGERDDIWPLAFLTDPALEANAELAFLLRGADDAALDAAEADLLAALETQVEPHAWKGAGLEVLGRESASPDGEGETDAAMRVGRLLRTFLSTPGVVPVLAEESEGFQGYSNPFRVVAAEGGVTLDFRIRDFDDAGLERRERHVLQVCEEAGPEGLPAEVTRQYANMGPQLAEYPELVRWAEAALGAIDVEPVRQPIRGSTGVDPFLARGVGIANLGTGYFAPESEKELTSRQNIARHTLWLCHLVQIIAAG